MEEGMPLIRCSGPEQTQEASLEKDEEPPGNCIPLKTSVRKHSLFSHPAQPAVILPFTGKRLPRTSNRMFQIRIGTTGIGR